jgi:hypothetical protein
VSSTQSSGRILGRPPGGASPRARLSSSSQELAAMKYIDCCLKESLRYELFHQADPPSAS